MTGRRPDVRPAPGRHTQDGGGKSRVEDVGNGRGTSSETVSSVEGVSQLIDAMYRIPIGARIV
jgi:hypothetical protein